MPEAHPLLGPLPSGRFALLAGSLSFRVARPVPLPLFNLSVHLMVGGWVGGCLDAGEPDTKRERERVSEATGENPSDFANFANFRC